MKKSFLVFFFFSISLNFFAQGIAVQGIARDNASSAITDIILNFTFSITQDDNTVLYAEAQSIRTDNYGVFSHIVKNGNPLNGAVFSTIDFSIQNLKMKVSVNYNTTDIEVYDQTFQYTPYAHFAVKAANGVPTGSIIAFIGGDFAPPGWAKCEGQDLSPTSENAALIALVGTKAPDLRGLFLRGTGANGENSNAVGGEIGVYQEDATKRHIHSTTVTGGTTTGGEHFHTMPDIRLVFSTLTSTSIANTNNAFFSVSGVASGTNNPAGWGNLHAGGEEGRFGGHNHNISGSGDSGLALDTSGGVTPESLETRPANAAVVYIIKL
jgi:microcystin-dependent protein